MSGKSGSIKKAGVIGHPVSHSLSPVIHGYWLQRYHIEGSYLPLPMAPDVFEQAFRALPAKGYVGVNITLPYKEKIFSLLDAVEPTARAIGAVNTVRFEEGRAIGSNTDAYGFWQSVLESGHVPDKERPVLVLGAGGAAKAVVYALRQEGYGCVVANRTLQKAQALADHYDQGVDVLPWEDIAAFLPKAGMLVNTTSLGMEGQPALAVSLDGLQAAAVVADIVYRPRQTALLKEAALRGNPVVEGLGMLLHQARGGFHQWFGLLPEVDGGVWDHLIVRL